MKSKILLILIIIFFVLLENSKSSIKQLRILTKITPLLSQTEIFMIMTQTLNQKA